MRDALVRLGLAGMLCAGYASAQPERLLNVEKWRFRYTYTASRSVKAADAEWTYQVNATADILLDTRRGRTEWLGHPNTEVNLKLTGTSKPGCGITQTVEYSGPATRTEEPSAGLSMLPNGYFIDMGNPWVMAKVTTQYNCPGLGTAVETEPRAWTTIRTDAIPYPAEGMRLSGTLESSHPVSPIVPMIFAYEPVDAEIT